MNRKKFHSLVIQTSAIFLSFLMLNEKNIISRVKQYLFRTFEIIRVQASETSYVIKNVKDNDIITYFTEDY